MPGGNFDRRGHVERLGGRGVRGSTSGEGARHLLEARALVSGGCSCSASATWPWYSLPPLPGGLILAAKL